MKRAELEDVLRAAKNGEPDDIRDQFYLTLSPRDYFELYCECHPKMTLPWFSVNTDLGYVAVAPDLTSPDGTVDVVID